MLVITAIASSAPESGVLVFRLAQFGPIALATVTLAVACIASGSVRSLLKPIPLVLAAFTATAALSSLVSPDPIDSLSQAALLAMMLTFCILSAAVRWISPPVRDGDIATVIATVAGLSLISPVIAFIAPELGFGLYGRMTGPFSNANYLGMICAIAFVGLMSIQFSATTLRNRLILIGTAALVLVPLLLSGSRGSFVAAAIGLLGVLISRRLWKVAIGVVGTVVAAVLAILLIFPAVFSRLEGSDISSGRLEIFGAALETWWANPILGIGYHQFRVDSHINDPSHADGFTAHNLLLQVLAELGILGVGLLITVFVLLVVEGRLGRWFGLAVTVLALEMTEASMLGWAGPTALVFWLVVLAYGWPLSPSERRAKTLNQKVDAARDHSTVGDDGPEAEHEIKDSLPSDQQLRQS